MARDAGLVEFQYASDDLATGSAGDNSAIYYCKQRLQVFEVGIHITANYVPGGTSVVIGEFDRVTASQGVTASEVTAPTRSAALAQLISPTTNVTVQDGKVISQKVDFVLEKGEQLVFQQVAGTSGTGVPYFLAYPAGQSDKEPGEQRSNVAVE